ncbi:MAG: N-acetylneuraminate synthase family protein [Planctomycetota bacterium]
MTDAAAEAGADAVKVQYFETDRLMSRAAKLAAYQKAAGETNPIEMLRRLELSLDEMALVVERAHARGIHAIVTVFSVELIGAAETLAWDAYKTASPDLVHRPLLERLMATGKPMIVSTGASTLDEVVRAVGEDGWLREVRDRLAVLQCVSSYPIEGWEQGLGGIPSLSNSLGLPIGYSDHTQWHSTGRLATAFGACVLEKHITDDRRRHGPDHRASLLDMQLRGYIELAALGPSWKSEVDDAMAVGLGDPVRPDESSIQYEARAKNYARTKVPAGSTHPAWDAIFAVSMNAPGKRVLHCERDVREVSRQSIVTTRSVGVGEVIGRGDVTFKRPGTGLLPYQLDEVLGRKAVRAIGADVPVVAEDVGLDVGVAP